MLCNEDENLEVCSLQSIRLVNVWLDSGLIYIGIDSFSLTRFGHKLGHGSSPGSPLYLETLHGYDWSCSSQKHTDSCC